jgi:hypothetical protein
MEFRSPGRRVATVIVPCPPKSGLSSGTNRTRTAASYA